MGEKASIVEISTFGEKVLITFSDGKMALLEAAQIRRLAKQLKALIPLPEDLGGLSSE